MKILCVANESGPIQDQYKRITIGQWYNVIKKTNSYYLIIDNNNLTDFYYKHNFITEKQYRKQKLQKINTQNQNDKLLKALEDEKYYNKKNVIKQNHE